MSLEPTTLAERYTRAMHSSRLQVQERTRGDVDVLIAAGWVPEHLGTMLYRLAAEFDAARGDHALARRRAADMLAASEQADRTADKYNRTAEKLLSNAGDNYEVWIDAMMGLNDVAELRARATGLRRDFEQQIGSERAFLLMKLKTLASTKHELGLWALHLANLRRFRRLPPIPTDIKLVPIWRRAVSDRSAAVLKLSGRVLDVFLDGLCARCDGRGFVGGAGTPQKLCRACSGTGKRAANLGGGSDAEELGRFMLAQMEVMLARVDRAMTRYLSTRDVA